MPVTRTRSRWSNGYLIFESEQAGGDEPRTLQISASALAGNAGFRQGTLQISVDRVDGQAFKAVWDGNPDCALKIGATNRANNLDGSNEIGGLRGLDLSARNRGTNLAWVNAAHFGSRNDSGTTIDEVKGISIRAENYGKVNNTIIGLDVDMSVESVMGAPERTAVLIRNTDQSSMTAVENVFKISKTAVNGFINLFNIGNHAPVGGPELLNSASIGKSIAIKIDDTPYYLAAFAAAGG